tara:strand:- start:817 stop:2262 length:1446 start_codon:yes stop_codon:yes gene_type:complete
MAELDTLFENIRRHLSKKEEEFIRSAYEFAKEVHASQKRYSGEPYVNHLVRSTETLASFGVDVDTIIAGLLHDTVEDCGVKIEDIEKRFNKNIALLVAGVSKLGTVKYQGRERYIRNIRHLFISTASDVRVILIKLADRLDNIRTLEHVPKHKQKRIALETLEIYAPIANRLGMGKLKKELEECAFAFAYPKDFEEVDSLVKERGKEREKYIKKVYKSLAKELVKRGISDVKLYYRIKDVYSIYKKLLKKEMDVAKIYDLYAVRVIVPSVEDCYRVLGIIHNMWKPLPSRIKDYIANPKINGYQSLHTTVFTGDGGVAEIQVRTPEMDQESKYGIAAHLIYKEKGVTKRIKKLAERLDWLSKIREIDEEQIENEPEKFISNLKIDFLEERIFVFTPKGDVIELPKDATALDFAYSIHSEVGNHTSGVRVNGKMVSLDKKLASQDIVEILTKNSSRPTRKWLGYVKTSFARKYIKNALRDSK